MPHTSNSSARRPWGIVAVLALGTVALWWQPWSAAPRGATTALAPAPVHTAAMAPAPTGTTPVAEPPAGALARRPALTLVGTSVGGSGSFATVRTAHDAPVQLLRVGDRIDGFTVTAVESQRLVLSSPGQRAVVIDVDRSGASSALAAAPRTAATPASPPADQRAFADGEAPWDAGPNFRH